MRLVGMCLGPGLEVFCAVKICRLADLLAQVGIFGFVPPGMLLCPGCLPAARFSSSGPYWAILRTAPLRPSSTLSALLRCAIIGSFADLHPALDLTRCHCLSTP